MNLGENIYKYRTQKRMSQGDLANALDVSRQSVSKWENNSAVPELGKLILMAELFGVSLDALVGREAPNAPAPSLADQKTVLPLRQILGIILFVFTLLLFLAMFLIPHVDTDTWLALICACILLTTAFLAYHSTIACWICIGLNLLSFFLWLHGSDSRFNLWFLLYSTPISVVWGSLRLAQSW